MVRHRFTLAAILVTCISTVFSLPAPQPHETEVACGLPRLRTLSLNGVPVCSLPSTKPPLFAQTLEPRAVKKTPTQNQARKPRGKVFKKALDFGIKVSPKRVARLGVGPPKRMAKRIFTKTKQMPPMALKKAGRFMERKENLKFSKLQKFANNIAKAKQNQKAPLYSINPETAALTRPRKEDMATKAWDDKEKADKAKKSRKEAYRALSPLKKEKKYRESAAQQAAKRAADIAGNVKERNRQKRIRTKAQANAQRKAENRKNSDKARAAYDNAIGLPISRKATYTSPQGKIYSGKDIRQAVFASEYAKTQGGLGYSKKNGKQAKNSEKVPKKFQNRPNDSDKTMPLPGAGTVGLSEFPILQNKQKGHDGRRPAPTPDRIITKVTKQGKLDRTELVGMIGHGATGSDHYGF